MNGPFFIETLARNGDVMHRHRLDALPIRLGRGYDNDFIVDDDYAAARHAVIEAGDDGALVLRDLGTRNGVVHRGRRHERVVLTGDTVVRMGHTSLRVRGAGFAVPPELADRTLHGWEGALPGSIGIALFAAVALLTTWVHDALAFEAERYLSGLVALVAAGLLWAGVWAFANRLFGRHARLGRHLFIAGCAMAAITLCEIATGAAAFAFSLETLTRYGSHLGILLAAGMVYFHLATIKPRHRRRFAIVAASLALLISGTVMISNEQRTGRVADELFMAEQLSPSLRVSPDHSVDDFMGRLGAVKARLDAERLHKVKGGEAPDDDDDSG